MVSNPITLPPSTTICLLFLLLRNPGTTLGPPRQSRIMFPSQGHKSNHICKSQLPGKVVYSFMRIRMWASLGTIIMSTMPSHSGDYLIQIFLKRLKRCLHKRRIQIEGQIEGPWFGWFRGLNSVKDSDSLHLSDFLPTSSLATASSLVGFLGAIRVHSF